MPDSATSTKHDRHAVDALYRISGLLGKESDPVHALEGILDEVLSVFSANSVSISLINESSDSLSIEVEKGLPESCKGFKLPLGVGVTGWVVAYGKPFLCPNVAVEEKYFKLDDRVRAEMAAPLTEGGRTVGALNVDSCVVDAFDEEDLRLLVLMAKEASRVLENAWMVQQLRKKAEQLQGLVLLGRDITGKRKFQEVLDAITRQGLVLLECDLSAFFLYDPKQDTLRLQCLHDKRGVRFQEETIKPGDSMLGTALRGRRQVQTTDLPRTEELHFMELIRVENLRSMLVTPVVYESEPIGLITHYLSRSHRFNDDERMIARALSDLGAISIQNARLYERVFDTEESMRKSERLTTLGTLAAEIAHEIRNPLMVIRLLFDTLKHEAKGDSATDKDLQVMREKIGHLEQIAGRILEFGKSREAFRQTLLIGDIMEDACLLVRLKLEQSQISLRWISFPVDALVLVDKGQIQQVLLNLILNAVDAMPQGGEIFLDSETTAERVYVSVRDTGRGIPPNWMGRIFDSFLTGRSGGTGLGLTIAKRIMRSHDGDLELLESSENGTTFRFYLPLAD